MSVIYCEDCDKNIDLDFDDEHIVQPSGLAVCDEISVHDGHLIGSCYQCKLD